MYQTWMHILYNLQQDYMIHRSFILVKTPENINRYHSLLVPCWGGKCIIHRKWKDSRCGGSSAQQDSEFLSSSFLDAKRCTYQLWVAGGDRIFPSLLRLPLVFTPWIRQYLITSDPWKTFPLYTDLGFSLAHWACGWVGYQSYFLNSDQYRTPNAPQLPRVCNYYSISSIHFPNRLFIRYSFLVSHFVLQSVLTPLEPKKNSRAQERNQQKVHSLYVTL